MDRKAKLHQRLTEQGLEPWRMQNADVGENGKFPIGTQPIGHPQVLDLRDKLEQLFQLHDDVKASLREVLAVTNSSAGLQQFSPAIRDAISALEAADSNLTPFELQTAINGLHRALGGSGTPYIR